MTKILSLLTLGVLSLNLWAVTPENFSEDADAFRKAVANKERILVDFSAHW